MKLFVRFFTWLFRGHDEGQSLIEYLILVGACALVGIAGFSHYGQVVKKDLAVNAKHIEGEGLPTTEGLLGSLGADYNELPGWCVKPNYCFVAGTPVQTETGDRPIESVRIGERIWARDVETGAIALRPVLQTYRTPRVAVIDLELSAGFAAGERLLVTRGHRFWVEGTGWVRADALAAQPLWSTEARLTASLVADEPEPTTVYNLEVAEFHSYFVGHSHVLVHNGNPDECATPPPLYAIQPHHSGPLTCGESGSYKDDLGAGRPRKRSNYRDPNGMERDHIPSGGALKDRANRFLDQLIMDRIRAKCLGQPAQVLKQLERDLKAQELKVKDALGSQVENSGFTVALPKGLHALGRTFRWKNNEKVPPGPDGYYDSRGIPIVKQLESDSDDLHQAAEEDIATYEQILAQNGNNLADKYTISKTCRALIESAFQDILRTSNADYDAQLSQAARQQFDNSSIPQAIDQACAAPAQGAN